MALFATWPATTMRPPASIARACARASLPFIASSTTPLSPKVGSRSPGAARVIAQPNASAAAIVQHGRIGRGICGSPAIADRNFVQPVIAVKRTRRVASRGRTGLRVGIVEAMAEDLVAGIGDAGRILRSVAALAGGGRG